MFSFYDFALSYRLLNNVCSKLGDKYIDFQSIMQKKTRFGETFFYLKWEK